MKYLSIKTQNKTVNLTHIICSILCLFLCACKNRNYILYYNKVNEIDSIYRIAHQPEEAIKHYRKLFAKYNPKNQDHIEEYETYINLSDHYLKNFGGKKSLYKLIPLIAPYEGSYQKYYELFGKYGIDSTEVKQRIADWKKGLNKRLVDSFSIAFTRDQAEGRKNPQLTEKNDKINAQLLKWTFENYGYPSMQKIALIGNNNVFMPMHPLFSHMIDEEEYSYFKMKMLEYIKSGDCIPKDYANMVDRHDLQISKTEMPYGSYPSYTAVTDTAKVNRNRKTIGLLALKRSSTTKNKVK